MNLIDTIKEIQTEFPDFKMIPKSSSKLMKAINVFLKIITFGLFKDFMVNFTTTIGNTVYTPDHWAAWPEYSQVRILKHEKIHMQQSKKYGRILYSFLYLFFPLPFLLCYFRAKFEKEAYAETIRVAYEQFGDKALNEAFKQFIIKQFTGPSYLWMWPFPQSLENWYNSVVEKVKNDK